MAVLLFIFVIGFLNYFPKEIYCLNPSSILCRLCHCQGRVLNCNDRDLSGLASVFVEHDEPMGFSEYYFINSIGLEAISCHVLIGAERVDFGNRNCSELGLVGHECCSITGFSLFGLAICLFAVAGISSFHAALLLFTVGMGCRGAHHAGVSVNPQDFAPNHTGAVFGVLNTAAAIPGFVGVYIAGCILEWTHSWSYVFIITGIQCLCGMVVYVLFSTGKQII